MTLIYASLSLLAAFAIGATVWRRRGLLRATVYFVGALLVCTGLGLLLLIFAVRGMD